MNHQELSAFIWSVADLLRGDYKPHEYGQVILPFTVLRRLDCVLADTKEAVLAKVGRGHKLPASPILEKLSKQTFFNTSRLDLTAIVADANNVRKNLYAYLRAFSPSVRDIFERFDFFAQIDRLNKANLLYYGGGEIRQGEPAPASRP